jgi:hypothetical protein
MSFANFEIMPFCHARKCDGRGDLAMDVEAARIFYRDERD